MMKLWLWYSSSALVLLEREERRGQEGKAHEAWLDLEPEDGISIAEDVE
jgi:hypothetical protein